MKRTMVNYARGFHVLLGDARSQAATLVIEPGRKVGGHENSHGGADQWIYVVAGEGEATVAGETFPLIAQSLVLIERGESHGFRNTGDVSLQILTFYVPPAYDADENELPAGRP